MNKLTFSTQKYLKVTANDWVKMSSKNATFEMGNGEKVLIPEGFESFSCTLRELYQAISQGSEEVVIPLRRIQNTDPASIQSSLETIFEFYDQVNA